MSYIDRIKIAVKEEYVKELGYGSLYAISDGRKLPTNKPAFNYRGKWGVVLIDISVPRTLFENTLEEATVEDKDKLVSYIQLYAKERELDIPKDVILNADIWYLELGKNIILPSKYSLHNCLIKLNKCLVKNTNWLGKVYYYDELGHTGLKVCARNKEREVCFYDKTTKEIVSRKQYNNDNQTLFTRLLEDGYKVLRYEVKFFTGSAVKRELGKFGIGRTFNDIWDKEKVQNILTHYWKDIEETLPTVRNRKAGLIKSIETAVKNKVSCFDIVSKIGVDYLTQELGATLLKQLLVPCEAKIKGKTNEVNYGSSRKNMAKLKGKFRTKKEYIAQRISQYIKEMKPIRVNKETGDIEGVL